MGERGLKWSAMKKVGLIQRNRLFTSKTFHILHRSPMTTIQQQLLKTPAMSLTILGSFYMGSSCTRPLLLA